MTDLVIIGGGPAGMGAAVAAYESGIREILILERDEHLGGILQQCIHNGFGLHRFGEELTGPEYAWKYEKRIQELGIPVKFRTMVLSVSADRVITATNEEEGIFSIEAKAIILAMGCRERPRGALNIAGTRPAGIYSAGTAQEKGVDSEDFKSKIRIGRINETGKVEGFGRTEGIGGIRRTEETGGTESMTERNMTCIICPMGCPITVKMEGEKILEICGNTCKRGAAYAEAEVCHPERTLTTTMRCDDSGRLAVKTDRPIPKSKMMDCMDLINAHTVSLPVFIGEVVLENVFGSNIVATQNKSQSKS